MGLKNKLEISGTVDGLKDMNLVYLVFYQIGYNKYLCKVYDNQRRTNQIDEFTITKDKCGIKYIYDYLNDGILGNTFI